MELEGSRAGVWELTKPCANEESGDALGVVVLLALENFTSHRLLLQLKRQKNTGSKDWVNLEGSPGSSVISWLVPCHQDSCQLLTSWPIIPTEQGREFSRSHDRPSGLKMLPTRPTGPLRSSSSLDRVGG